MLKTTSMNSTKVSIFLSTVNESVNMKEQGSDILVKLVCYSLLLTVWRILSEGRG